MPLSIHQASIPVIEQMLSGLTGVLDKAAAHVAERKLDPNALLLARMYPDMYHFAKQVQVASAWGVNIPAMLCGATPPKLSDDASSFEALKARVAAALESARAADASALDAAADKVITFPAGPNIRRMKGCDFLLHFALPHFFFHCTTAYDLMRHNGVVLAKRDYMGPVKGVIEG